ncbi:MAG: acetyltransferase [Gorillibacterium sp.]|nr:acetyltransferase [Gorillibacterium sp.]
MVLYQAEDLTVRRLKDKDAELLVTWLSDPHILQYYEGRDRPHDLERVREHFYKAKKVVRCIIEFQGKPIGYIQYYPVEQEARSEYGYRNMAEVIYGTDQFIGEVEYWNKGIGQRLVASMLKHLMDDRNADRIVMDPQAWNHRAIACYEKCGLKKVRILKEHEMHEGVLQDCWLMEYSRIKAEDK